jgi:DNA-binding transcriptional ArsR family regulator
MNIEALTSRAIEAEQFLKALANRNRLIILCELHGGERAVAELASTVGLSQSALSQHLARLREDGLVATRREGTSIFYELADARVSQVVGMLHQMYCNPHTKEILT